MIGAIEPAPTAAYVSRMRSLALRLLSFLAVLLMPLGMQAAPAQAHDPHATSTMPMEHCPNGQSKSKGSGLIHSCTMACSAALPAADLPPVVTQLLTQPRAEPCFTQALTGIELEIATPPPRPS